MPPRSSTAPPPPREPELDPSADASLAPTPSPLHPPPPTTTNMAATLSDIFHTSPSPPPSPLHPPLHPLPPTTSIGPTTHPSPAPAPAHATTTLNEPSDIPRLRSTHATAGYRDAIAAAKTHTVQAGFDEGYALAATVAMRVGWVLGVLEGMRDALVCEERAAAGVGQEGVGGEREEAAGGEYGVRGREKKEEGRERRKRRRRRVEELVAVARGELCVEELFGARYWGGDGVWQFVVVGGGDGDGGEEDGGVTFREVAEQHPLVRKWVGVVVEEAGWWGVGVRGFEGVEWEGGRVGG